MSFPEPEILTSLVQRIFRIDDLMLGDPQKGWVVRYRGHLLDDDSAAAYDLLADSVRAYGLTPLFRQEGDRQTIYIAPSLPEVKKRLPTVNIILFVLTVFSVMLAGVMLAGATEATPPSDTGAQMLWMLKNIFTGWPFALSLLGILLAHEFGHYLMSRHHKTDATLPYFIPFPFSILGTMGAFIQMQSVPKNKHILFDIGVAGPLAGLVVAVPVLFLGLWLSRLGPIEYAQGGFLEGNSLLYLFAKFVVFGKLLPAPVNLEGLSPVVYWLKYFFTGTPVPYGGMDVQISPIAMAGWAGLLVTALNLIPVGTLDGGHVAFGLFGEKAHKAFFFIIGFLVILSILPFLFTFSLASINVSWFFWIFILQWLGRVRTVPLDDITALDPKRRALGYFMLIVFLLVFSPVPMVLLG
jgi:membrane-associated protease RseP (regulator of RpoE activity)